MLVLLIYIHLKGDVFLLLLCNQVFPAHSHPSKSKFKIHVNVNTCRFSFSSSKRKLLSLPAVFFDLSKADAEKFDLDPSGMGLVSYNSDTSSSDRSDSLDNEFSCDSKMNIRIMQ